MRRPRAVPLARRERREVAREPRFESDDVGVVGGEVRPVALQRPREELS